MVDRSFFVFPSGKRSARKCTETNTDIVAPRGCEVNKLEGMNYDEEIPREFDVGACEARTNIKFSALLIEPRCRGSFVGLLGRSYDDVDEEGVAEGLAGGVVGLPGAAVGARVGRGGELDADDRGSPAAGGVERLL